MQAFGTIAGGKQAHLCTLQNGRGMRVDISDYGATVVRLMVPDRQGVVADVVLGFDSVEAYAGGSSYFGSTIGRFANRIADGCFRLDGLEYRLATNNEPRGIPCHLHGGRIGFDKALWSATPMTVHDLPTLRLHHFSEDGDEGYPGNLELTVTYVLTEENALRIEYEAVADRPTPVNFTNHTYFNLLGEGRGNILGHRLLLVAHNYTPVSAGLIPTCEIATVEGTPLDFTAFHAVGERIDADNEQLRLAGGYDHNYVLDSASGALAHAAAVYEPQSGRCLDVWTTEPGVQFYSGNFLDGTLTGKSGRRYVRRGGLCLETQHFPDSPNQRDFPDTILRPGRIFRSTTVFCFSVR